MRDAIRVKHYSYRTEETYIYWIRRYILFHNKRHPSEMGTAEVTQFLTHLAVQEQVAASTQNQVLSAIVLQSMTIALHRITLTMQGVTLALQVITLGLQSIALALQSRNVLLPQEILTKNPLNTLVLSDRFLYAVAMLVFS